MPKHRGLFWSLALTALLSLTASQARAELISMTLIVGTGGGAVTIPVDPFAVVTPTSYTVNSVGLTALNALLAAAGSQYQFATAMGAETTLGGSSNFGLPSSAISGQLSVTGELHALGSGTGTNDKLTLIEVESGWTSPTGPIGILRSSAGANFTNQPSGGGIVSHSEFNAQSTPSYTVLSTSILPNPGDNKGPTSNGIAPVSTLFTLRNFVTWGIDAPGLTKPGPGGDVVNGFSQSATIAVLVPEPASLVTMLLGVPFPLVVFGLLRRRRAAAHA
jgi:hypothetical protein